MKRQRWLAALLVLLLALGLTVAVSANGEEEIVSMPVEAEIEEIAADLSVGEAESDLIAPERGDAFDAAVLPTAGSLVTITKPASGTTLSPGNVEFWCRFDSSAFSGSSDVWKFATISVEVLLGGTRIDAQTLGVSGNVSFAGEGRQYATLNLTDPGEYTIRASVPGSPDVWDSVTFTIGGADPTAAPGGDDIISPDAPQTDRRAITDDNLIIITYPQHGAKLTAGTYKLKARFNTASSKFDSSMYDRVKFEIVDHLSGDAYDPSFKSAAVSGKEFTFYEYEFELGGVYTIRACVGDDGVWDSVDVAVTGPAYYPGEDGKGKYTITPRQSEYTIDLAKSDTVRVDFTMTSAKNPDGNLIYSTDYCPDCGVIIQRVGYNRMMGIDYPATYDEKTGLWSCEGSNTYKGLKVGTTTVHLYIDVDRRYDRHPVTIHVIDSSKNPTPAATAAPAQKTSLEKAKITVSNQVYTGSKLKPKVTVKLGSKTLVKNTDYTVRYSNSTNVGLATVKISGTGSYTGTATGTFKINPKKVRNLALKAGTGKLTATWKKVSGVTGYQVQYATRADFSNARKINVTKTSATLTGLKTKKKYYVRVRSYKTVSKKNYYSAWSGAEKKTR